MIFCGIELIASKRIFALCHSLQIKSLELNENMYEYLLDMNTKATLGREFNFPTSHFPYEFPIYIFLLNQPRFVFFFQKLKNKIFLFMKPICLMNF